MADVQRITYATDFSTASLAAFPHAVRLTKATGAELTILHVLPAPTSPFVDSGYVPQEIWDQLDAGMRAHAGHEMDRLVKQAVDAGVRATTAIVDGGIPADEIVRAAESTKADLLVLGTHGRTGVARLVLGSVAARVVATASCPVLTVRMAEATGTLA
ncbi:MAG TPA: universal stress protein [Methylomirabilota bacterium]|nr:universal stress protein [Methylomirabilota bacterium]